MTLADIHRETGISITTIQKLLGRLIPMIIADIGIDGLTAGVEYVIINYMAYRTGKLKMASGKVL